MSIKIEKKKIDPRDIETIPLSLKLKQTNVTAESNTKEENSDSETQDILKRKVLNKYHLPVLNINKADYWPSLPLKERRHFTDQVAMETCLGNCCGYEGLKAACCQLDMDDLEHVLGNLSEEDIERLLKHLRKATPGIKREDVVIEKEEGMMIGRKFFNDHPVFNDDKSYPMLRLQIFGNRFVCKFLSTKTWMCTVYGSRPEMCSGYYCKYIKRNFLIRTGGIVNAWEKVE
jgi:hypothetical protein